MKKHILYYDGTCGFCHWCVQFVLRRDTKEQFLFAPLQGTHAISRPLVQDVIQGGEDTVVLETPSGEIFIKSDAVRQILARLGGVWRVVSMCMRVVPVSVRDWLYDRVGQVRHRIFRKPHGLCPAHVVTDDRFLE